MSGISEISSILSHVFSPNTTAKSTGAINTFSSTSVSAWSDTLTIADIRDKVDNLATSGQLTSKQQISLIDSGLQDLNPYDKSYQPSDPSVGLNRKTGGTFDAAALILQKAAFNIVNGESDLAKTNLSLAALFEEKEGKIGLSVTN